jgi:hypothetical protein
LSSSLPVDFTPPNLKMSTPADTAVFENVTAPGNWGDLASPVKGSAPAKGGLVEAPKATFTAEQLKDLAKARAVALAKGGSKGAPEAAPTVAVPNFGKGSSKTAADVFATFGLQVEAIHIHKMMRDTTEQVIRTEVQSSIHAYVCELTAKQLETLAKVKDETHWVSIARLERVAQHPKVKNLMDAADTEGRATLPLRVAYIEAMLKGIECLTGTSFPMARTLKCSHHIKALGLSEPKMCSPSVSKGVLKQPVVITAEKVLHIRSTDVAKMLEDQRKTNQNLATTTAAKDTFMLALLEQLRQHREKHRTGVIDDARLRVAEKHYLVQQGKLHSTTVAKGDFDIAAALAALQTKLDSLVSRAVELYENTEGILTEEQYLNDCMNHMVGEAVSEIWSVHMLPFFAMPGADPALADANAAIFEKLKRRLALSVMQSVKAVLDRTEAGEEISIFTPDYGFGVLDATNPAHSGAIICGAQLEAIKAQMMATGLI